MSVVIFSIVLPLQYLEDLDRFVLGEVVRAVAVVEELIAMVVLVTMVVLVSVLGEAGVV